jgi:DNA replication protein DnaC
VLRRPLQLSLICAQLADLLDQAAKRELTHREVLASLCEREIGRRNERCVEMATKIIHFPTSRDLDGFDFAADPSINKADARDRGCAIFSRCRETRAMLPQMLPQAELRRSED